MSRIGLSCSKMNFSSAVLREHFGVDAAGIVRAAHHVLGR